MSKIERSQESWLEANHQIIHKKKSQAIAEDALWGQWSPFNEGWFFRLQLCIVQAILAQLLLFYGGKVPKTEKWEKKTLEWDC